MVCVGRRGFGPMGETDMPGDRGLCDTGKKTRLLCEAESETDERDLKRLRLIGAR